jgi:hypothetical protein
LSGQNEGLNLTKYFVCFFSLFASFQITVSSNEHTILIWFFHWCIAWAGNVCMEWGQGRKTNIKIIVYLWKIWRKMFVICGVCIRLRKFFFIFFVIFVSQIIQFQIDIKSCHLHFDLIVKQNYFMLLFWKNLPS